MGGGGGLGSYDMARCAFICACKLLLRRSQQQQQRLLNLRQREAEDFIMCVILHWQKKNTISFKRSKNVGTMPAYGLTVQKIFWLSLKKH